MTVISGYQKVLSDQESLGQFLRSFEDFNRQFCDLMTSGVDFTLKIEVRGDKGELLHCRVDSNQFRRPEGVDSDRSRRPMKPKKQSDGKKSGNPL